MHSGTPFISAIGTCTNAAQAAAAGSQDAGLLGLVPQMIFVIASYQLSNAVNAWNACMGD